MRIEVVAHEAISARLELRLVVSNDTSRASMSTVLSRGAVADASMRRQFIRIAGGAKLARADKALHRVVPR